MNTHDIIAIVIQSILFVFEAFVMWEVYVLWTDYGAPPSLCILFILLDLFFIVFGIMSLVIRLAESKDDSYVIEHHVWI
jgi:hypothetical protein